MTTLKPLYNSQAKKSYDPVDVEGDGTWILYGMNTDIGTKQVPNEIDISFGVCYCHATNDQSVLFTLCNKAWTGLTNHFLKKKNDSGNWVEDADKVKAFEEVKLISSKNKGRSVIYAAGHEGLEAIIKHYNGKWIKLDGQLLTKDATKVTTLLVGIDSGNIDEDLASEVTNGDIALLPTYSDVPRAGLKGKPLPVLIDPDTKEVVTKDDMKESDVLGIPLALEKINLPVVRFTQGNRGKSSKDKYNENLAVILEVTGCADMDALVQKALDDPMRIRLAYATLGSGYALSEAEFEAAVKSEVNLIVEKTETTDDDD